MSSLYEKESAAHLVTQRALVDAQEQIARLRACLESTRDEICEGPVDDVLWHDYGTTTVDNISMILADGWTYDGWAEAKSTQA